MTSTVGVYVDATLGGGGHAEAILQSAPNALLIGIDADEDAIEHSRRKLHGYEERVRLFKANFRELNKVLASAGIEHLDGVLFDLGVSSYQLDVPEKGFSYRTDERLDMRMDRTQSLDAFEVVNHYREDQLALILRNYGEEPASRRIARAITYARERQTIETTADLAAVISEVVVGRNLVKCLSRVFQALRIEVNDELGSLRQGLYDGVKLLRRGGRVVVISYHSLEDRIVKQIFHELSTTKIPSGHKLVADRVVEPQVNVLTKKPLMADRGEIMKNRRARSAKLRAAEKR